MSSDYSVEAEIIESDVELDNSDVVEPDFDPPQQMGDSYVEVTEENREAAQVYKSNAMDAILEGKLDEAVSHLTKAIALNPKSPILYASRASIFVKLKKPNAAIGDANVALKMNGDFAKGYKARGMAKALLGAWEGAAKDLQIASDLDFDEETGVILRKVGSNVKKIVAHRHKYELLRKEKEQRKIEREAKFSSMLNDGQVIVISSATELRTKLNAASALSRLAIVYFTATWCGPCRYVGPLFASWAGRYPKVVFLKVDVDEASDAAAEWRISSIPSFYLFNNGKVVDKELQINMSSLERKIVEHCG